MTKLSRLGLPLILTAFTVFWIAASALLFRPLHESGSWQGVGSFVNSIAEVLGLPGQAAVVRLMGQSLDHAPTGPRLMIALIVDAGIYYFVFHTLRKLIRREPKTPSKAKEASASVPSRRQVLRYSTMTITAGALGLGGYSILLEPRRFHVVRRKLPINGLPAPLHGLRLIHLTDIHLGPWLPLSYVHDVVRAANALEPDVVVLTGDYIHRSSSYMEPVAKALGALSPRIATIGTLGNHDWWHGAPRMSAALSDQGVRMIDNARCILRPDKSLGDAEEGLCFAGVGDFWEDSQDYDAALGNLPDNMPRLLLSHNPDVAEENTLQRYRVDLMLSGHTHGGQVRLPGLGTPAVPSQYGQKYAHGLVTAPTCQVHISAGLGMALLPVRLGVRPEIVAIELVSA